MFLNKKRINGCGTISQNNQGDQNLNNLNQQKFPFHSSNTLKSKFDIIPPSPNNHEFRVSQDINYATPPSPPAIGSLPPTYYDSLNEEETNSEPHTSPKNIGVSSNSIANKMNILVDNGSQESNNDKTNRMHFMTKNRKLSRMNKSSLIAKNQDSKNDMTSSLVKDKLVHKACDACRVKKVSTNKLLFFN